MLDEVLGLQRRLFHSPYLTRSIDGEAVYVAHDLDRILAKLLTIDGRNTDSFTGCIISYHIIDTQSILYGYKEYEYMYVCVKSTLGSWYQGEKKKKVGNIECPDRITTRH
jgi:hypothetical protein